MKLNFEDLEGREVLTFWLAVALVVVLVILVLNGCALGRIRHDGGIEGLAIGHAKIEDCVCSGSVEAMRNAQPLAAPVAGQEPTDKPANVAVDEPGCRRIEGGALSSTFVELISTAIGAAATYFTAGAAGL